MNLIDTLKRQEGFREKPYQCTSGVLTIGYGFTSLSANESEVVLRMKVAKLRNTLSSSIYNLSPVRRDVLVNMAYNLGTDGLFKFRRMWQAIYSKDFATAANEMLDSKWADQVGDRAVSLAEKMREG